MTVPDALLIAFILISLVHLAAAGAQASAGRYITKALLMPVLALYYVTSAAHPNSVFVGAILSGWLGDVFLMLPDRQNRGRYFRYGLICFSLGHVLYIFAFVSHCYRPFFLPAWGWAALTLYVAAAMAGYALIASRAGKMLPAISAYIMIITLMGISTMLALGSAHTNGVVMTMAGAFLFMVSDAINAYNRMVRKIPCEGLLTMGTYLAAQFLLVQGFLFF